MIFAREALERLREGNRRYVAGRRPAPTTEESRRELAVEGQEPFAVILGCSDSRVPAEIVFDQGLGTLFVVRVAGNVIGACGLGSVEFAVERLGTPLVVVLGHSGCGAVQATMDMVRAGEAPRGGFLAIVDRIRPSLVGLRTDGPDHDPEDLLRQAVRANVCRSVADLRRDSTVLDRLIRKDELLVVGAEYSLETGVVEFLDGAPGAG